jgi:translation initiation factor IF-3
VLYVFKVYLGGERYIKTNEQIRADDVRLVDENGEQVGIIPLEDALRKAEGAGMDLVEVSPMSDPPVCKIMDYGKYKYQKSKKLHEAKKKQKVIHVKEIKLRPKTEEHDINFKEKHVRRFLQAGDKVRLVVVFRGRENMYTEQGIKLLERMAQAVEDLGSAEGKPTRERNAVAMVISPHHHASKA